MSVDAQYLVDSSVRLAERMVRAARLNLHLTLMVAETRTSVLGVRSGWLNGEPEKVTRSWFLSPVKAYEMLYSISGRNAATPLSTIPWGCGYKGGVRLYEEGWNYIVGASFWHESCDQLFAALMAYAMTQETRFHHVGFRHESQQAMLEALHYDETYFVTKRIERPASDHERFYLRVSDDSPNGYHYVEHQFFPSAREPGIHWDVATSDPYGLLRFIGSITGVEPIFWDREPNSPIGVISALNHDGTKLSIMARDRWWEV